VIARSDEPTLVGEGHERGAVAAAELAQDVADVGLRGERADHQAAGDLGVAEAAGDQLSDLALAVSQLGQCRRRLPGVSAGGELGDQPLGGRRRRSR